MWYRVEDDLVDKFWFDHVGFRHINFLDYNTYVTDSVKTASVSIADYLQDERDSILFKKSDWIYDPGYINRYNDPYWTGNILEDLDRVPTGSWYGQHVYYSMS